MIFREALIPDIPQMQVVRNLVKENVLSDPALVTDFDCEDYITRRGKGWVCEDEGKIVGFAVADLAAKNVWALFVDPAYENRGIGKSLHRIMMDWFFSRTDETVWLGTAFNTRAEKFYRLQGWKAAGLHGKNEIRFEMKADDWKRIGPGYDY